MGNFKYFLEDHKEKIILGGVIGLAIAGATGVIIYMNKHIDKKLPVEEVTNQIKKADAVVYETSDYKLKTINLDNNDENAIIQLSKDDLVAKSPDLSSLFIYEEKEGTISNVSLKENKLDKHVIVKLKKKLKGATELLSNGKEFVLKTDSEMSIIDTKGNINSFNEEAFVKSGLLMISESSIYSNYKNKIFVKNFDKMSKTQTINVYDETIHFEIKDGQVFAMNKFGEKRGQNMLLQFEKDSLNIANLLKIDTTKIVPIETSQNEPSISFIETSDSEKQFIYNWEIAGEGKQDKPDKQEIEGNWGGNGEAVSVKGYVYALSPNELKVYNARNGKVEETKEVKDSEKDLFVAPIFSD